MGHLRQLHLVAAAALVLAAAAVAAAQAPPPPIRGFVVDVRGTLPFFPSNQQLADSRGLTLAELPGVGKGLDAGAHLYLKRWKSVTIGIGGQATFGRSTASGEADGQTIGRPVTERFTSIAPQISFNFGTGNGWSYVSGGIGTSTWSVIADGEKAVPADSQHLKTINYGGGARWFLGKHVAFHVDLRFYAVDPGAPDGPRPGGPRSTFLTLGSGVSIR